MVNNDMQMELEQLRAEVAALKQGNETMPPANTDKTISKQPQSEEKTESDTDLNSQIQELVDTLEQELKDTRPMTLLIVFTLGILIGRLLPR